MTTDAKILSALRENPAGVSGADLAGQLGVTRAAIWGRIEQLRQLGYEIEAGPHFGYRLVSAPDVLHADDLLAAPRQNEGHRPRHPRVRANDLDERRDRKTRPRRRQGGRGRFCRVADEGPGTARPQMDFARTEGTLVFRFAAAGFAPAGSDAIDGRFRHGPAPRDSIRNRFASRNQMAERHFDWREKSRGHFDRVERGTGPGPSRHPGHRRGRESGRGRVSAGIAQAGDFAQN